MMAKKLMVVDGHSLMYRAFHALPLLDDGKGIYTNAVHGFLGMLFSAIEQEQPDYLGVAFDLHGPTFRHEQYDQYKATRSETPMELRPQFDVAKEILSAMDVPILSSPGYEGDDILGTMAKFAQARGIESVLITGDRDSFQLATDMVTIIYTKRGISDTQRVTPAYIGETYGIKPLQLIDVKALMGDKSDNIPGIMGIGEKTALKLIQEYGNLETALAKAEAEQKGKLKERLTTMAGDAILSKQLATIDCDAKIEWDEGALTLDGLAGGKPLLEKYGLRSLLRRKWFEGLPDAPKKEQADIAEVAFASLLTLKDANVLADWAKAQQGTVAIAALDQGYELANDKGERVFAPYAVDLLTPGFAEEEILSAIAPLFQAGRTIVAHSGKQLRGQLAKLGISCKAELYDLMLAAYVLDAQKKSYALIDLVSDAPEFERQGAGLTMLALQARQTEQMAADSLTDLYTKMELPLSIVLGGMERCGFKVDKNVLQQLGAKYMAHIESLTTQIQGLAGREININSPKQLGDWLFEELQISGGKKTARGYTTSAEVLEQVADEHEAIPLILEYRKYAKLHSTYIEALLRLCGADGRIHTSFDQVATATGRISSLEPNLQNIPVRTAMGREIREAFVADSGMTLVDADYSQIELRVLAHMSGDAVMTEAFRLGQDIHRRTAAEVYQVPLDQVTKQMRSAAKAVNFGIVYGISDFGLAKNIGVSRKEAKAFIERYLARYEGIKAYMDRCIAQGKADGYVKTLFGRRRYLPQLQSSNFNLRAFGERAAMNSPIQGTAADIIKLAMVKVSDALSREGLKSRLILQVHDELIIEAPIDEAERAKALLRREMQDVVALSVPLVADVSSGGNWNECK